MAKKPKNIDFDTIVIGTGSGGGVASHILARAGRSVAVVEQEKIGGECPNYGCVPTKAILQSAEILNTVKKASDYGITLKNKPTFKYADIKALKDRAVKNTGTEHGERLLNSDNIQVLRGHAHFIDPWTISIAGKRYSAHSFLIATGTHDFVPPVPGLEEVGYIGYREALELKNPPKRLFVIGGGAIGCEFAHALGSFGSSVHIADMTPHLLGREDEEVGELVGAIFENNGIKVHTSSKIVKVSKGKTGKVVTVEKDGKKARITVDEILLAAGKVANTDIGLENAGVEYDRRGIHVDRTMRTTNKHIYAAGDVTGGYMFTHVASYESRIAAHNILSHGKILQHADYHAVPRCVFIEPEVASVGLTEQELKKAGKQYQVGAVPFSQVSRSNTAQEDVGFVKILANKKGVILGASIVGPRAGELIHELTLATQWRMKASKIEFTMHAFPTWSQAIRLAASRIVCR